MRVEKWQALGNDYLIVDHGSLPWVLTPERVGLLCDRHQGFGADGILVVGEPTEPGFAASLTILNPDGSEAELSGNGARQAILYLRRSGVAQSDEFSIQTRAGEVRASIIDDRTCTMAMGRARVQSNDFPDGPADGVATIAAAGRDWQIQHLQVGNPQAAIRVASEAELASLDLDAIGPELEHHAAFPNRTNVSFYTAIAPDRIRARIFERGVGETQSSGTGASGAGIAHVLRGGESPVTVVLDGGELIVDVEESLLFSLAGWAEPVYEAQLSDALLARLAY
jgi:diaminopimelate epimerase